MATNWQLEGPVPAVTEVVSNWWLEIGDIRHTDRQIGRKFRSVKLRKIHRDGVHLNNADVDGAGRADVGHGAKVGDLVDGPHQLEVGGKIGDNTHRQFERKFKSVELRKNTKYIIQYETVTTLIWMELDGMTLATGLTLETWSTLPTNWRLVVEVTSNWWLVIKVTSS